MRDENTQQNIQRLLDILKSRTGDPRLGSETLSAEESALTPAESKFLKFWLQLPFTAHHATQNLPDIQRDGALRSIHDRLQIGPLTHYHTGGAARQQSVYFSFGVDGTYTNPRFIGENPAVITLPLNGLRCGEDIKQISMSNHDQWFAYNQMTDPIEINKVIRHIQFNEKRTKVYHYQNIETKQSWQIEATALQETYAANNALVLFRVLGLKLLLELYQFGGELRAKILKDPAANRILIIKLFQLLFPSEIYPEIQIQGCVPLSFPGIKIQPKDITIENHIKKLHHSVRDADEKAIAKLLEGGASLEDVAECVASCCDLTAEEPHKNTLVITAFRSKVYDIGFGLIQRGANIQTINWNYPDGILQIVIGQLDNAARRLTAKTDESDFLRIAKVLDKLLTGIDILGFPGIKQHFSLAHHQASGVLDFIKILQLSQPKDADTDEITALKNSIIEKLIPLVPFYDAFGLMAECYSAAINPRPLLEWLQEQKCDIHRPSHKSGTPLSILAAWQLDIGTLHWALSKGAKVYLPSHAYSQFRDVIRTPIHYKIHRKITLLEYLLLKQPLEKFSPKDIECIARLLQDPNTIKIHRDVKAILTRMHELFSCTPKSAAIFAEVKAYPILDQAVGGVIFATLPNKKTYTLLIVRSEYQTRKLIRYCGPGGTVNLAEAPADALLRETAEEVQLKIDPKYITTAPIVYEHKDAESGRHLIRYLYTIELKEWPEWPNLPSIAPYDDAWKAVWADTSEFAEPIWTSNSLVIQAHRANQPVDRARAQRALYAESIFGQAEFAKLIEENKLEQAERMLDDDVDVNSGNSLFLAMKNPDKKPFLKKLIAAGADINQMTPGGSTLLLRCYNAIPASEDAKETTKSINWLKELINDFHADWTKYTDLRYSFLASLMYDQRYSFIEWLINRGDTLSPLFFDYLFKRALQISNTDILTAAHKIYPGLTQEQLANGETIVFAAENSLPAFKWLLDHGIKVSRPLLIHMKNLRKEQLEKMRDSVAKITHWDTVIPLAEKSFASEQDKVSAASLPAHSLTSSPSRSPSPVIEVDEGDFFLWPQG